MDTHFLGFGLGLRTNHFHDAIHQDHNVDWFEILSENYMVAGGKPLYYLRQIRERHPVVMHGVSLSLGSMDPLNRDYLQQLKHLAQIADPQWFSDHLCWTGIHNTNTHDLLPLPYDMKVVRHVGDRIRQVQDFIGKPFLLENVSSYLNFEKSTLTEWDFVNELINYADCYLLLDVNNIHVSARNHGFNPTDYLCGIDIGRVKQIHLAGHSDFGDYIIDTHDHAVADDVWRLYGDALKRFGAVSTMIERDANIPPFHELVTELDIARRIAKDILPAEQLNPAQASTAWN